MGKTISEFTKDSGSTKYNFVDVNIAPVQLDTTAIKKYEVGDQFVLDSDGKTYKATQEIAQNGTIIIKPATGYNAELAGTVSEQLNQKMSYVDNGILGAKQLLPMSFSELINDNVDGTWSGNDYVYRGITFTPQYDSKGNVIGINANGTNTHSSWIAFFIKTVLNKGNYILSGTPNGSSTSTYYIQIVGTGLDKRNAIENGETMFTVDSDDFPVTVRFVFLAGKTVSNKIFRPMVRLASDSDSTFQPYAKTNLQLTYDKAETSVISEYVEDGATCKNPNGYSVGQHFQRNGKFCTCIANTAQNETWTLNTNYVEGTIADNMSPVISDITTTTEGITLDSTFKQIVKVGNMCQFKLRFTCANDISEETTIATLPYIPITTKQLLWLEIHSLSVPYSAMDNSAYIYGNGRIRVYADATYKLLAGTYDISGIYMTKY